MSAPSVIFVLPSRGGNGGSNSVVQEALGLAATGWAVGISMRKQQFQSFRHNYPEIVASSITLYPFGDTADLAASLAKFQLAVATIYTSVYMIEEAIRLHNISIRTAYYVQDYEVLFAEADSEEWAMAHGSYTKLKDCTLFAKTRWLQEVVEANHGVRPEKVEPSIDHSIYFPDYAADRQRPTVVAMLRPRTPRRAPIRTLRILQSLRRRFEEMEILVFGSNDADLAANGMSLPEGVINLGRLKRTEVPFLLRKADLFIDASDYQAFGRTGLEAMASGCIPILPLFGGATEYAEANRNAFLVDSRSDDAFIEAASRFLALSDAQRAEMRARALVTAARFTTTAAVHSEARLFQKIIA